MTSRDARAYAALAARDKTLADLIATYGRPPAFEWHDGGRTGTSLFAAMLLHVVGQQISAAAAFTIYDRIADLAGGGVPAARAIAGLKTEQLRQCGLSQARAGYVVALADAEACGVLDIEHLAGLPDADTIVRLTAVRGIGLWSAQTFLLHNLARPDVLPEGDNGIRQAIRRLWHLDRLPPAAEVRRRGLGWSPYRSYAAALLWRSLRPAGEVSDPKQRALQRRAAQNKGGAPPEGDLEAAPVRAVACPCDCPAGERVAHVFPRG